jgi:membrane protein implicated in regulation of membrane protease activity
MKWTYHFWTIFPIFILILIFETLGLYILVFSHKPITPEQRVIYLVLIVLCAPILIYVSIMLIMMYKKRSRRLDFPIKESMYPKTLENFNDK